jgi:hypothetical protein
MVNHTHKHPLFALLILMILTVSSRLIIAQETPVCGTDSGEGCAPASALVDLAEPSFSNPTTITNPLFPISQLHRVLLFGTVDGLPFRTETTLLPDTRTIEWNGQQIEVLESQYVAFLDDRIHEVALDWYAQADDGSVWYFGEDVFNYEDGAVADTEGTWLAGRDGPPAMIMPADPQVGDVYRSENIPGLVYEEVTVTSIGETVHGPAGAIEGAIVTDELHMEGSHESKIFAPGYGEFLTGGGGELEAVALAVPTDALADPTPAEVETLYSGALDIFDAAQSEDWNAASATLDTMLTAWNTYRAGDLPRMLDARMGWTLVELVAAVDAHQPIESSQGAINVARASLDFQLRHRPVTEIDVALFDLWTRQVLVDSRAEDSAGVLGDVTTLEWVWDRITHTLSSEDASNIESLLGDLRSAADAEDLAAATETAQQLLDTLAGIETTR